MKPRYVVLALFGVAAAALFYREYPALVRYLKAERM